MDDIYKAVEAGDVEQVQTLIKRGANINVTTVTPLHIAAGRGYTKIVEMLLDAGAEITRDGDDGYTPLDWAKMSLDSAMRGDPTDPMGCSEERDREIKNLEETIKLLEGPCHGL